MDRVVQLVAVQTTTFDDWRAAITLVGEFDAANAALLRNEIRDHLDAGRRVLRIDCGGVDFIDSTAIAELVDASARCLEQHGSLILTNVPACMRRLITVAGLERQLLIDSAAHLIERPSA